MYIEKELFESLIDIFIASSDLELDESMMDEQPLTLDVLIKHDTVQKTVSENIFTEKQIVAAI